MLTKKIIITALLCLLVVPLMAQTGLHFEFKHPPQSGNHDKTISSLKLKDEQQDSAAAYRYILSKVKELQRAGFMDASLDSLSGDKSALHAVVYFGYRFKWAAIQTDSLDEGLLSESGLRERLIRGKPLTTEGVANVNERLLTHLENHGFPFATLRYTNFKFDGDKVTATLDLDPEQLITIDSIIIKGDAKISTIYIENYLAIKPGDIYNESLIRNIPDRVKELAMVTEIRPFSVTFTDDKATVYLYLNNKKASQIDGILGVLPDYQNEGKVRLTGEVRMKLLSAFGRGELIDLNWKNPQPQTQDLKIKFNYPFLFNSPFGIDLNLGLYKKDTTYLDVNLNAGVQISLKGNNYFKVFVNSKKSSLLSTSGYQNITVLPPYADISVLSYGIGARIEKLDYRLNPTRGFAFEFTGAAGEKVIRKNAKLNEALYDSTDLETVQYNGQIIADTYIPVTSRFVIDLGIGAAGISGSQLYSNELIRFGGLKTLRGFDEESLLASVYVMGKAEFRLLMDQNSFLFTFINGAWYERNANTGYLSDTPFGFGAGITFETKLGIFSVNYALGKEFDNPVRFRAAKIHFGLVNYF